MSSRPAIFCLLTVLATAACDKSNPAPEQANSVSPDEAAPATRVSTAGKVDRSHKGEAAPAASFADPAGKPVTLASFRGKSVALNLWATWCAPCVKEMPTLDAAATAGANVIAVSQDMEAGKVAPFFAARKFARLQPYTDAKMALSLALGANLPTTILYDAGGREIWRVTGDRDWTSAESRALLAEG